MVKKQLRNLVTGLALAASGLAFAQDPVPASEPSSQLAGAESGAVAMVQPAPSAVPALEPVDLKGWLAGYMSAALEPAEIAGAVVSVVKDGHLLFSQGYGYADVAAEAPMDPARTLVRVGSTSKLFTWTAVMQLVEQGRLDLDRDVSEYLDFDLPESEGPPVTMLDLMTHRGGFEEGLREVLITDPALFITTEHYLKQHPRPRIFPAGALPAYSNYGTALAGYIVERISGEPFEDYIDRHLLAPLDMRHSTFRQPLPARFEADMSRGYITEEEAPWPFELVTTAPAGSLSATAEDMANFMLMHLQAGRLGDHQVLRPETARRMHSATLEHPPGFGTMAHGFFSGRINGRWVIGHGGDTVVFHTDMNLLPEEGVGIFVSFNSRGKQDAVYGIRQRLFDDFMDRYFPDPNPASLPTALAEAGAHAQSLAGHYWSSRRIESGFLRLLYLLQQAKLVANDDGTLSFTSEPEKHYREVAPGLWREEGGEQALSVSEAGGRVTIVDSANPTAVLQSVPAAYDAGFNLLVLVGSIGVLLLVVVAWPIDWAYHRRYAQGQPAAPSARTLRPVRLAALGSLLYLVGWYFAFQPLLVNQLDAYGTGLDGLLRSLQFAAIVPLAAAAVGLWHAWRTLGSARPWPGKLASLLLAAALLGVVWVAWVGGLMSLNLEY